jgi:hypothetical protein
MNQFNTEKVVDRIIKLLENILVVDSSENKLKQNEKEYIKK